MFKSDPVGRHPITLSHDERIQINIIKNLAHDFYRHLDTFGEDSDELNIARVKIQEAAMWAVKHITH